MVAELIRVVYIRKYYFGTRAEYSVLLVICL